MKGAPLKLGTVTLILVLIGVGCGHRPPAELKPFMGPLSEQSRSKLQTLSPEQQVELFLQVRQYSRPPNYFLASEIASQKPGQVLEAATNQLSKETDESTEVQLIDLIHVICVTRHVCGNEDRLLSLVSSKVGSMNTNAYRQEGTALLEAIHEATVPH